MGIFGRKANESLGSLIGEASFYLVWWECLRSVTVGVNEATPSPMLLDGPNLPFLAATAGWMGLVLGCLLLGCWYRLDAPLLESGKLKRALFAVELGLTALACVACAVLPGAHLFAALLFVLASACLVFHGAAIATALRNAEIREVVTVSLGCLAAYGFICVPMLPLVEGFAPPWMRALVGVFALVGAYFASGHAGASREWPPVRSARSSEEYRAPVTLLVSLFFYGFVFGLLHVLPASMGWARGAVVEAEVCATVLALLVLAALFYWSPRSVELWSKFRGTVFPLLAIGFTLLSSGLEPRIALAAMDGAQFLYYVFVAAICIDIVQLAFLSPGSVVAKALLWNSLGAIAGTLFMLLLGEQRLSNDALSLLAAAVIALLSVATFWIGSDEQIRKNWGIRRKLSPKQFHDASIRSRCQVLAKAHRLTPRETQVIIALAQGRRPAEIQEEEGVTIHTVRAHIQHAYAKLEIHSTAELQALLKTVPIDEMSLCVEGGQPPQSGGAARNDRK